MESEASIQRLILEFLSGIGIYCWRNNNAGIFDPRTGKYRSPGKFSIPGVSDIFGFHKGKFFAIEVKKQGSNPTQAQKDFMEAVRINGNIAFVARSIGDVKLGLTL